MEQHNLRENVALISVLQHTAHPAQPQLVMANTHVLFNPKRGEVKLGQARVLSGYIGSVLQRLRGGGERGGGERGRRGCQGDGEVRGVGNDDGGLQGDGVVTLQQYHHQTTIPHNSNNNHKTTTTSNHDNLHHREVRPTPPIQCCVVQWCVGTLICYQIAHCISFGHMESLMW